MLVEYDFEVPNYRYIRWKGVISMKGSISVKDAPIFNVKKDYEPDFKSFSFWRYWYSYQGEPVIVFPLSLGPEDFLSSAILFSDPFALEYRHFLFQAWKTGDLEKIVGDEEVRECLNEIFSSDFVNYLSVTSVSMPFEKFKEHIRGLVVHLVEEGIKRWCYAYR